MIGSLIDFKQQDLIKLTDKKEMNSLDKTDSDRYNLEIDEKNNNLNNNFNNNFNHKLICINNSNKIYNITAENNNLCD